MLPLRLAAPLVVLAAALLAGCDFTPTLDIDLPEHQERAVISALLVVDSVAVARIGVSRDPYVTDPSRYNYGGQQTRRDAAVTLLRDGQPVERLRFQSQPCDRYGGYAEVGQPNASECGSFVGTVPLAAGATYTVRAVVPGLPAAEGTVTMPRRPALTVTEEAAVESGRRRFQVRVADPSGRGQRYGVALIRGPITQTYTVCEDYRDPTTCREEVNVQRYLTPFTSPDPVILAAGRSFDLDDNAVGFVSVTDDTFDGQTWSFTMTQARDYYYGGDYEAGRADEDVLTVQVASLSGDVYDTYQIATFGGQGEGNPFAEPINLPSNVTGGYGLVGGLALAEVTLTVPGSGGTARR